MITPANVPTWAYAEATPTELANALAEFTKHGETAKMPMPSHITLLPNLGSLDLGFETLTDLEKWGELLGEDITRSNYKEFTHYSITAPYMISGRLHQIRMTYITR
jgi:hypothetical protein